MRRGRRLAFDFGQARIGVAVCDPDGILATPLEPVATQRYLPMIKDLIAEYEPIVMYVGLPLHLSGENSESTQAAQKFAHTLQQFDIAVELIDERLTTRSAARSLSDAGYNAKESKSRIDSAAAVAILEQGLAMERK